MADPVVAGRAPARPGPTRLLRQVDRRIARARRCRPRPDRHVRVAVVTVIVGGEELGEVRLDGEAGLQRGERRIGGDLRGVEVQFLAPDQSRREALLHDRLEEAAEDVESIPLAGCGSDWSGRGAARSGRSRDTSAG